MARNSIQEHLLKREHQCDCLSSRSVVSYIVWILETHVLKLMC